MERILNDSENERYIAESADVLGQVTIGKRTNIWYNAVVRGDTDSISIGDDTNIQDGCIIHTDFGMPVHIGSGVTVGHASIIHGCDIGDDTLIGMGAIVLNGAKIGKNCIIGAGALVTQNAVIPDGMMAFGSPAKVVRPINDTEIEGIKLSAEEYIELAIKHFK